MARFVDEGRGGRLRVRDQPTPRSAPAALWPISQVVAAALLVRPIVGADSVDPLDRWFALLDAHRRRRRAGYLPFPGGPPLYYDDNAWVGLDQVQATVLGAGLDRRGEAAATLAVVLSGRTPDGAVRWRDVPGSPVNTCATAPALQLALRLALLEPDAAHRAALLDEASVLQAALDRRFRRDDGLYADHVDLDGRVDHTCWAYNQGTPVGAAVAWWRLTGDEAWLDRAQVTVQASIDHFRVGDRLWTHPPVFVAVWLRNLLAFDAARPVADVGPLLDGYLDAVWDRARDPRTGALDGSGIGRYDAGGVIDHTGLVQLLAVRAWPRSARLQIC